MNKSEFILKLKKTGAIKFGKFTLKSGVISPFYLDLREIISYPKVLNGVVELLVEKVKNLKFDLIAGIPYTALPIATLVASKLNKPLIYIRKEEKSYGAGGKIIGKFQRGDNCLIIDDLITTGASKIESAEEFERVGVTVKNFVVIIDRSIQGKIDLAKRNYKLHSLISLNDMVDVLKKNNLISNGKIIEIQNFTSKPKISSEENTELNPLIKKVLNKIHQKKSNLILSLDVTKQQDFFEILDKVGDQIVMLKTHIDIITDFDEKFIPKLLKYAKKQNFFILEDRKFADIGNTVHYQFRKGIYKIADWAEFVTSHLVAGPGTLHGLFDGLEGKSAFVLARMSSQDNLINENYTRKCFEIARQIPQFVAGFIGHGKSAIDIQRFKSKFPGNELLLVPGVKLESGHDNLGQQYLTVEDAMNGGADCIIVGRGILKSSNPKSEASLYRKRAWEIYQKNNRE